MSSFYFQSEAERDRQGRGIHFLIRGCTCVASRGRGGSRLRLEVGSNVNPTRLRLWGVTFSTLSL